jgi:putative ubiquitin-RnfH superfamily antitoxin RatB of RatAB toxin-antitoxin module
MIRVEIAVLDAGVVSCRTIDLPAGSTVQRALAAAGVDAQGRGLAVFGHAVAAGRVLRSGERIEVLGPLTADPKLARMQRVQRSREAQQAKRDAARRVTQRS